jgi:hypothetical protein
MERCPGASGDARCFRFELASPQCLEEVTHEDHALALSFGEPHPDQVLDASAHRVADLAAEAAGTQGCRLASDELAIEPSCAAGVNLRLDRQVGPHGERDASSPGTVVEAAELDDATRRRVSCRIQIR